MRLKLLAATCAAGLLIAGGVHAQPSERPSGPPAMMRGDGTHGGMMRGGMFGDSASQVEARIAFVRTELGITPEQAPLWERVAETLRSNAAQRRDLQASVQQQGDADVVQRYRRMEAFHRLMAQNYANFAEAFQPLHARLTDEQKQKAEQLLLRSRGRMEHGGMPNRG